jgi:hypothetical protein
VAANVRFLKIPFWVDLMTESGLVALVMGAICRVRLAGHGLGQARGLPVGDQASEDLQQLATSTSRGQAMPVTIYPGANRDEVVTTLRDIASKATA